MPEPSDRASPRQTHANRIARRTLRERPKLVGTTADGEPVYEVRSVRLVLRGESPAFNRILTCERCGQDQGGAAVLSRADLDAPVRPMICAGCIRRAGVSGAREPEPISAPPEHPVPAKPREELVVPAPAAPHVEPGRLESTERRLLSVAAQVEELSRLEAQLRRSVAGLAHLVEAQRVDLTAVVRETARARTEVQRAVDASGGIARAQERLEQRIGAIETTRGEATPAHGHDVAGVPAAVDRNLGELAAQVAELSSRMDVLVSRTQELAGQRRDPVPLVSTPAPPRRDVNDVDLIDTVELQLQQASERLSTLWESAGGSFPRD